MKRRRRSNRKRNRQRLRGKQGRLASCRVAPAFQHSQRSERPRAGHQTKSPTQGGPEFWETFKTISTSRPPGRRPN
jgi:hypothetical protein